MSAPEDALAEILAEHRQEHQPDTGASRCSCGEWEGPFTILAASDTRSFAHHVAQVLAEWVAGARDQIAAEALREAADASLLGQRGPRVSRDWLRDRADRLDSVSGNVDAPKCPECGEPQEVPGEGRYCGDCEDYEGHCVNDHCMTCGRST